MPAKVKPSSESKRPDDDDPGKPGPSSASVKKPDAQQLQQIYGHLPPSQLPPGWKAAAAQDRAGGERPISFRERFKDAYQRPSPPHASPPRQSSPPPQRRPEPYQQQQQALQAHKSAAGREEDEKMESVLRLKRQAEESVAAMKGTTTTTTTRPPASRRLPSVEIEADDRLGRMDDGRRNAPPPSVPPEERQYSSSKYAEERRELEEEKRSKAPTKTSLNKLALFEKLNNLPIDKISLIGELLEKINSR